MKRILLVEDEHVILKALTRLLERKGYDVQCASTVEEALAQQPHSFDLILTDLRLPGDPGTTLIRAANPVPVIIMTSHASVRSAVDAMRHGAIDYIAKPFDHDELLLIIERSLQQNLMQSQNRALKMNIERLHSVEQHIEGTALEHLLETIIQNRLPRRCLHLHGESGTDKESMAKAIHASSQYKNGPFLILDISADTASATRLLLGQSNSQPSHSGEQLLTTPELPSGGYLQAAQNGTLVIRHPELLDSDTQRTLYAVMKGNVLSKQSSAIQRTANVELISISMFSIEKLIDQGHLIDDLAELFVPNQFEIPPLRHRPNDIVSLANRHLTRLEIRYAHSPMTFSDDAMAALMASDWLGNVAELESLLERAVLQCRTRTITLTDLGISPQQSDINQEQERDLSLDEYFRYFVIRNQNRLSETELAARLGISRKALWERRQKMSLLRDTNENLSS